MSSNFVLYLTYFFCGLLYAIFIIGIIVFSIFVANKRKSQNKNHVDNKFVDNTILEFLKHKKNEGKTTIDELITELELVKQQTEIKQLQNQAKNLDVKVNRPSMNISSAEVLLYVGSFLITFAMFVLVALGWSSIPGIIKNSILTSVVLFFFIGGFILNKNE